MIERPALHRRRIELLHLDKENQPHVIGREPAQANSTQLPNASKVVGDTHYQHHDLEWGSVVHARLWKLSSCTETSSSQPGINRKRVTAGRDREEKREQDEVVVVNDLSEKLRDGQHIESEQGSDQRRDPSPEANHRQEA